MRSHLIQILLTCILLSTSTVSGVAATDKLPNSNHPLWEEFAKCRFVRDEVKNLTMIGYTVAVRRLDRKEITISGFMTPLESTKESKHFLLNKNNPTCAFCPPSRTQEVIEVFTSEPVAWHDKLATFSGTLVLINDARARIFLRLEKAVMK